MSTEWNLSPIESSAVLVEFINIPLDWIDAVVLFLATHPMAIWIRNSVSVALGAGGTIGLTHPIGSIKETVADLLSL